jgi:hypothetical protein
MRLIKGQSIFYLAVAFFLVSTFLFLFQEAGVASDPGTETDLSRKTITAFSLKTETDLSGQLIAYPRSPAPGDFIVLEAGPLAHDADTELLFDFPATAAEIYRAGGLLYALIAISFDAMPGSYPIILHSESETLETFIDIAEKEFRVSRFSMPPDRTEGWTAARLAEDREKVWLAREETKPYPLWLQRFIQPLEGRISSEFGAVRIINNNAPRRHTGLDIAADTGTPVVSPNRGIVRLAEFLLSGGNTVIIDHGLGLSSTYMHLDLINVEPGQLVERGGLIGTVGMTGYATGPHLHWEVNIGQTPVNPDQLINNDLLWVAPAYVEEMLAGIN